MDFSKYMQEGTLDDELPMRERPKNALPQSDWRKNYNKKYHHVTPCADDVRKIKSYMKKGISDEDIKEMFKLSYKVLNEIKNDAYHPYKDRKYGPIPKIGRLSIEDVKKAREYVKEGLNDEEIAEIFGVCKKTIFNMRNHKSWTSVEDKS